MTSTEISYEDLQKKLNLLQKYSYTDSLTNLKNRRYLWEKIDSFIDKAIQEQACISCLMIDFDDFKSINDNYGHIEGDKVLEGSCRVIKSFFSRDDIVVRYGGEEILVLLYNKNLEEANILAEELRKKMEELVLDKNIKITVSIGIYSINNILDNEKFELDNIIIEADKAMYQAKKKGKNCVVIP